MEQSLKGSLSKYYKPIGEEVVYGEGNTEPMDENIHVESEEFTKIVDGCKAHDNLGDKDVNEGNKNIALDLEKHIDLDYDPGFWGTIDDVKRIMLVKKGPINIVKENDEFPRNKFNGRSFSCTHYVSHQPNGEKLERKWLVYSNKLNKVFCFYCKLFKHKPMKSNLAENGINDWRNLSKKIRSHENNPEHNLNVVKWVDLIKGLKLEATIDKKKQVQVKNEKVRLKKVLTRIIAVVKTLSRNGLPFRGTNEKIYQKSNGLFCQLIELLAEFDPIMQEHVRRVVGKEIHSHYLSHKSQNELISLLANGIKQKIIGKILKAKYFSIILDCTPDLSHEEQMSIIIRCVNVEDGTKVKIEEFFLGFIEVKDTTGLGLFTRLQDFLVELKLDIDDVRGQGYDNGANMKGKNQGVQKRLLDINPRALYVPCGCHSLNLALCDMSKSCPKARNFFGYVQKIYTLFSGSTNRWDILKKHVNGLTPKPLSGTRWESHIESVRAIRKQAPKLRDALIEISNSSKDDFAMAEAKGLCEKALKDFEFLISLCVWHKILDKINRVSKLLQEEEMVMEDALNKIQDLITFFQKVRDDCFDDIMEEAKELANEVGIDPIFPKKRVVRRNMHFDEDVDPNVEKRVTPEENFRVTYFLPIIDQALKSLKVRFQMFGVYEEIFGFLFNEKLRVINDDQLRESCTKLACFLMYNEHCDIDGKELFREIKDLKLILPKGSIKAIDILEFIRPYWEEGGFRNVWVAYRILLTIPVTVASAERSFSKLKLIKNYLRTTMSQERLSGLGMISIEVELLEKLEYDDLIDVFASKYVSRSIFI